MDMGFCSCVCVFVKRDNALNLGAGKWKFIADSYRDGLSESGDQR